MERLKWAERRRRFGEQFLTGLTAAEIARQEGIRPQTVRGVLNGLIDQAGYAATPGTPLPLGLSWMERTAPRSIQRGGRWYVMSYGRLTGEQVRWALAVLTEPTRDCPACGRPL